MKKNLRIDAFDNSDAGAEDYGNEAMKFDPGFGQTRSFPARTMHVGTRPLSSTNRMKK